MFQKIQQGLAKIVAPKSVADDAGAEPEALFVFPPPAPSLQLSHAERMAVLGERKMVTLFGQMRPDEGPVMVFFEPKGTYPGARDGEVFAAAALVVQGTRTLAAFQALSAADYASDAVQRMAKLNAESYSKLKTLPMLANGAALNQAFGDFLAWCWEAAYLTFKPSLDAEKVKHLGPEEMVRNGLLHVVHSGLLDGQEMHFFHRAAPRGSVIVELFDHDYVSQLHPLHIQRLSSMALGMGYSPFVTDGGASLLELPGDWRNPADSVRFLAEVFLAMKRRDVRLDGYRLQGW